MKTKTLFALSTILTLSACLTQTGSEGNLQMQYSHGYLNSANAPVAVGLTAIASFSDREGNPMPINEAVASDTNILSIQQIVDNKLYLQAETSGQSDLTIATGETGDVFILQTKDIAEVQFANLTSSTAESEDIYIVAGSTIPFTRHLKDDMGDNLTGFGLQGEVLPEAAGQWIIDDETQTIFAAIQEVGAFSLVYGESSKQYVAISPDDITEWVVNAPDTADLAVHQAFNIGLYGLTASKAIGVSNLISLNEDVCTVSALLSTTEYFILTTTAAGTCELAIAATEESVLSYNVTE